MSFLNRMRIHGDKSEDVTIVEKILRSITQKLNFVVCSIDEYNDIDELSLDELQSFLLVYEHKLNQQENDEQTLKVSTSNHSSAPSRIYRGRGKGSKDQKYQQRQPNNQSHGTHYYGYKPRLKDKSDILAATNHMCGDKSTFSMLDKSFRDDVKFGDNSKVSVMGKGHVIIQTNDNATQTISNVLFVPDLKTNLISIGQLQEKGYKIYIKDGVCRIQDAKMGLIAQVTMTANRMFSLYLNSINQTCFSGKLQDIAWVWNYCYGHLNFGSLRTLQQKDIVVGLPKTVVKNVLLVNNTEIHFQKEKHRKQVIGDCTLRHLWANKSYF
ncbi:hypothetical protein Pfo_011712 [Paulownia fortunei]|nr:hypothetical protein Pfo_011712 [Paulownia fortunei]